MWDPVQHSVLHIRQPSPTLAQTRFQVSFRPRSLSTLSPKCLASCCFPSCFTWFRKRLSNRPDSIQCICTQSSSLLLQTAPKGQCGLSSPRRSSISISRSYCTRQVRTLRSPIGVVHSAVLSTPLASCVLQVSRACRNGDGQSFHFLHRRNLL